MKKQQCSKCGRHFSWFFSLCPFCSTVMAAALVLALLLMPAGNGYAAHKMHEKHYQAYICDQLGGEVEHRLEGGERVDCLTEDYAIEVDFAPKWAESIGQSLFYASETGTAPAVVLIIEEEKYKKHPEHIDAVNSAFELGIKVWIIRNY